MSGVDLPALVRETFDLDAENGRLYWKRSPRPNTPAGAEAGSLRTSVRYRVIGLASRSYLAHRLVWAHVHGEMPSGHIDHINGDRLDNRPANLRVATRSQNMANRSAPSNNKSGAKGVFRVRNKWQAKINVEKRQVFIGLFDTLEEAKAAYSAKAAELFGEFARVA